MPLSTRAYVKGRAYIKIILKNHARSYFAGRSYYRGNTVIYSTAFIYCNVVDALCLVVPVALAYGGDVVSLHTG